MFKLNKKGFSFVELLISLTLMGILMISFAIVNGYLLKVINNRKKVEVFNDIIEITYYELKYNSLIVRETTKSQDVYLNGSAAYLLRNEKIDNLLLKETTENEYFLINIDCDYDPFINKVKIILYSDSNKEWEKVIYVPKSHTEEKERVVTYRDAFSISFLYHN
ncbi:type II secretion system protein [Oceanirhabdus sp. W0125-5]|uniref:type II secretion system protein n=1 Tax=Oceanirhabdus sp. W0125-5 TaxID=2999116 RepID=UPI0022F2F1B4|nr:prepilin-type N-terminal cleavage/methylation domain-containing protein [Oceanirhabdus sp. W0125-5]WBW95339.1 prepilin-type N-terminal cleavage/methylation domain-containing protein [Oceanirhabdus sp. W0125-5]